MNLPRRLLTGFIIGLALVACTKGPREIQYGSDSCAHCRMTITDPRFASQLITEKGKIHLFDSVECLAAYENDTVSPKAQRFVSDFEHPGRFIPLKQAHILKGERLRSPMGLNLAAFPATEDPTELAVHYGAELLTWEKVTKLVANAWQKGAHHSP
ncbi:MAG: nitrous oxide reductase accessory protein NosL [Candidatus Marinimicrobia bacterium]|nr:nitrous oxide reductase accessory protein NosL [Candidatus Neomarinimicrobiota bacterium]MCF7840662.1 nitrous oxide reductase accessory protein NosL [Candidatus Neomarinimicrobiota bacterium]